MQLEDEKVSENRKLRRLENQSPAHRAYGPEGRSETLRHADLLTFPLSCSSPSYFLIFQNIYVYSCSSPARHPARSGEAGEVISLYSLFSFLFFTRRLFGGPISGFRFYEKNR
ncbi:MAG: hypothetical protein JRE28_14225 [Deltaproteobacteria bacterium]|nr:hypothetical protein [Deltaproteobacteria bacterium]